MGASKVGKSSLITQFLYSRYTPKYKRTIEEMHQGNFNVAGVGLTLDILDTSGSNEVSVASLALLPALVSRRDRQSRPEINIRPFVSEHTKTAIRAVRFIQLSASVPRAAIKGDHHHRPNRE